MQRQRKQKKPAMQTLRLIVQAAKCDRCETTEKTIHTTVLTKRGTRRRVCRCIDCL